MYYVNIRHNKTIVRLITSVSMPYLELLAHFLQQRHSDWLTINKAWVHLWDRAFWDYQQPWYRREMITELRLRVFLNQRPYSAQRVSLLQGLRAWKLILTRPWELKNKEKRQYNNTIIMKAQGVHWKVLKPAMSISYFGSRPHYIKNWLLGHCVYVWWLWDHLNTSILLHLIKLAFSRSYRFKM